MKKCIGLRLLALCLSLILGLAAFAACSGGDDPQNSEKPASSDTASGTDFAGQIKFDQSSDTKKQEVTVKTYVDGDTTHFNVPTDVVESGVLKARYLAVNTPESTGKIEKWGKAASNFTKEHLKSAESIYIESDNGSWNVDSTGGRYLVWVWYKPAGANEYRNLNIELLQNGFAIASNSSQNRYGETCMAAISQAQKQKLHVYSNDVDELFYEGGIQEVTLKALRTTPDYYKDTLVTFEATIACEYNSTLYVEEYDEDDGIYYGMNVYYGYNADPDCLAFMKPGNRVKFVGSMQYYEAGGTWQISGLKYNARKPQESCGLVKSGVDTEYVLTDPARFLNDKLSVAVTLKNDGGEELETYQEYPLAQLLLSTTLQMTDLKVTGVYTTSNPDSSSNGAMTLTCKAQDGTVIDVRTIVLKDENNQIITAAKYDGKTIDVKGVVDYYDGVYQIKVFTPDDITVKN